MGRKPVHTADLPIEQKSTLIDGADRVPEIVLVDTPLQNDYAEALAFAEEPVTIRIEPAAEKNAPGAYPIWNNGKGCEVLIKGKWREMTYIPVGQELTVKRKYVATMLGAKQDTVQTEVREIEGENPQNNIRRFTSAAMTFSIIEDKNPKGAAWATEMRRRNF